jgi:hypothetical protein
MKQQHAALMTLGMMLMLACRGVTEERGRGSFERQVEFTAIGVPTLKNAPFVALVQSTWVPPTDEGYPHLLRSTARIMQDSAGTLQWPHSAYAVRSPFLISILSNGFFEL